MIHEEEFYGLRLPVYANIAKERLVQWKSVKEVFGIKYKERRRYFKKMGWKLGEDYEKEALLFQDVPRDAERQEVWITLAALYQTAFTEARRSSFCGSVVAQAVKEVRQGYCVLETLLTP